MELKKLQQDQQQQHQTRYQQKTLVLETKSCSATDNSGRVLLVPHYIQKVTANNNGNDDDANHYERLQENLFPSFALRENDYTFDWESSTTSTTPTRKIGGNAQSIGKDGFLHHTSFLWNYDCDNMMNYLTLPSKRPTYRSDRSHTDFLSTLQSIYPHVKKQDFVTSLFHVCKTQFGIHDNDSVMINGSSSSFKQVTIHDAMKIVETYCSGGLQEWYEQHSRNRVILTDLTSPS